MNRRVEVHDRRACQRRADCSTTSTERRSVLHSGRDFGPSPQFTTRSASARRTPPPADDLHDEPKRERSNRRKRRAVGSFRAPSCSTGKEEIEMKTFTIVIGACALALAVGCKNQEPE